MLPRLCDFLIAALCCALKPRQPVLMLVRTTSWTAQDGAQVKEVMLELPTPPGLGQDEVEVGFPCCTTRACPPRHQSQLQNE